MHEARFIEICTRCDECQRHCPSSILRRGQAGFPETDFTGAECTFCGDCVRHCDSGALSREALARGEAPWTLQASITAACLAHAGVVCRICADRCEAGAIRFRPQAGGAFLPMVERERCTGCGACKAGCPIHAVDLSPAAPDDPQQPMHPSKRKSR